MKSPELRKALFLAASRLRELAQRNEGTRDMSTGVGLRVRQEADRLQALAERLPVAEER